MRIKTLIYFALAVAAALCAQLASAQNRYETAVADMLARYPESTVADIYKSFFQDVFGPGHLIADTASARQYLRHELQTGDISALPYYEPVGAGENYYRVSLDLIKDGVVSEDEFFSAFLESAVKTKLPPVEQWAVEWAEILKFIPKDISGYAADVARIGSLLASGNYAMHHSRRFNEAYHPHYRLIDKEIFNARLLPKIKKDTKL